MQNGLVEYRGQDTISASWRPGHHGARGMRNEENIIFQADNEEVNVIIINQFL
jgi:hypothetical protein